MLYFFKKNKEIIILHLCTKNLDDMINSSCDIRCGFGSFLPFYSLKTWKIKILEKWQKIAGDIIILKGSQRSKNIIT